MADPLRIGIASQTPLVRMKRSIEELEAELGSLPDPLPLDSLRRGVDYSVTPGGVARMIQAVLHAPGTRGSVEGDWVTLDQGFPRDLALDGFTLRTAVLPEAERKAYGHVKEIAWEALNGLPPRMATPLEDAEFMRSLSAWSRANTDRLLDLATERPVDVYYVNDWQHLPQGRMLADAPKVMHYHAPIAPWTPPGWRDFVLEHMRSFDAVIVSCRSYVAALEKAGLERPVYQIYPWLDEDQYTPASAAEIRAFEEKYGIAEGDEVILNVGRMDPVKGQDMLIRAFARLVKRRPQARLVLVGNGSFSSSKKAGIGLSKGHLWRSHLEKLCRELRVEDRVHFTGHTPHAELMPMLARMDVFAFPSVGEGFGLAVAEAWLADKPVVVSPRAGIAEIVSHGEDGLVADPQDADAFASAIEQLLALPDRGRAMGELGHRKALAECSVSQLAPKVKEILEAHSERPSQRAARTLTSRRKR